VVDADTHKNFLTMPLYESFMVYCPSVGLYCHFGLNSSFLVCVEVSLEAEGLLLLGLGDEWVKLL